MSVKPASLASESCQRVLPVLDSVKDLQAGPAQEWRRDENQGKATNRTPRAEV